MSTRILSCLEQYTILDFQVTLDLSSFQTNENGILVVGSSQIENVDVPLNDERVKSMKKVSQGYRSTSTFMYYDETTPLAVGLLYGFSLQDGLISLHDGKSYLSLSDDNIFDIVREHLIDMVVVRPPESQATSGCDIFERLHPPWGMSSDRNYVLPLPRGELSLNRCFETTMKFLPTLYREQKASPGQHNFCQHTDIDDNEDADGPLRFRFRKKRPLVFEFDMDSLPKTRPPPILVEHNDEGERAGDDEDILDSIESDLSSQIMGFSPLELHHMAPGGPDLEGGRVAQMSELPQTSDEATDGPLRFELRTEQPLLFELDLDSMGPKTQSIILT